MCIHRLKYKKKVLWIIRWNGFVFGISLTASQNAPQLPYSGIEIFQRAVF